MYYCVLRHDDVLGSVSIAPGDEAEAQCSRSNSKDRISTSKHMGVPGQIKKFPSYET